MIKLSFYSHLKYLVFLVCKYLLCEDEVDFTDVLILGIGFLVSTAGVFLGVKVGNFVSGTEVL